MKKLRILHHFGSFLAVSKGDAKANTNFFDYLAETERAVLEEPSNLNELVYVLCCLRPDALSGKAIGAQNCKDPSKLKTLSEMVMAG